ncbi:hypothetical protein ACFWUZ_26755 [Streptomyces sp. NPDC058646]|uniref:zinc finger domain-containing protein n=1 Tax=Streptomyces sp. NPDC058646 TaxID=3346574 RepID=UPI003658719E
MSDDFKRVESHACPMSTCAIPAGSPCRTGKGKAAIQYHTVRVTLVVHEHERLGRGIELATLAEELTS